MTKKYTAILMAMILTASCMAGCGNDGSKTDSSTTASQSASSQGQASTAADSSASADSAASTASGTVSDMFADGDYKDVTGEKENASITLSGSSGTISDTTRGSSGSTVTITSKGIYRVTGSSDGVSIVVKDEAQSGNIYLILDNVTMKNASTACINVQACDKVIIQTVGESSLTYSNTNESEKVDGAIFAKDDTTINGSGTLNITSSLHGIVCQEDLKITGAAVNVTSSSVGIKADDSLRIGGGVTSITSEHDGVKVSNKDNNGYFYIEKGELTVNAGYDGISVKADSDTTDFTGSLQMAGGTVTITAGGGSEQSKDSSTSQKGLKSDGSIVVSDTTLTVSAADDAIHGNDNITIQSGTIELSTSDDGITAEGDLTINGGKVTVSKSYEALEATNVTINDGEVSVTASDDGINCSGGSDTTSQDDNPWSSGNTDAKLTINGGNVYVNAQGDGLDSNGSIYITGGTTIVDGPTDGGNGAIDKGDSNGCVASITGGTVLAIGSTGMAVNFDTGSQCSALVQISGDNGTEITVDDGSGFSYKATKTFACAVYSSPSLKEGITYTMKAGSTEATLDFSSGKYYSNVASKGGGPGGMGGHGGPA